MIVSQFELLLCAQRIFGPVGVTNSHSVLQGYSLMLTNLEDRDLSFQVRFETAAEPNNAFSSMEQNAWCRFHSPNKNPQRGRMIGDVSGKVFTPDFGLLAIQGGATAVLDVEPDTSLPPIAPGSVGVIRLIRGFVRLTLPMLNVGGGTSKPQSQKPVGVLVTALSRAIHLDQGPSVVGHTEVALPLASGKAKCLLKPSRK